MKNIAKILIFTFFLINSSFAQLSKVQIEIGTKKLIAEIADTDEEQRIMVCYLFLKKARPLVFG